MTSSIPNIISIAFFYTFSLYNIWMYMGLHLIDIHHLILYTLYELFIDLKLCYYCVLKLVLNIKYRWVCIGIYVDQIVHRYVVGWDWLIWEMIDINLQHDYALYYRIDGRGEVDHFCCKCLQIWSPYFTCILFIYNYYLY
jgi:hypothetical protein